MNKIKVVLDTGEKYILPVRDWMEDTYVPESGWGRCQVQGGVLNEDVGGVVAGPEPYVGCRVQFLRAPTHMIGGSHWIVAVTRMIAA